MASLAMPGAGIAGESASDEVESALVVVVSGAEPGLGQMLVSLFASEKSHMREAVDGGTFAVDGDGRAVVGFAGLSAGRYAVAVVYDRNGNGELDTGFLGIPKEKIGFSNNARGRFGPARWSASSFVFAGGRSEIEIALVNATD